MNLPPLNAFYVFLAALPILVVLYLMVGRNWGGSKAGPMGWATAVVVALIFFGARGQLLLVSWGKAILLSLYVLYIIWMALLFYHTVNEAGTISVIGHEMPSLAPDRPAQALLLAWIFGAFLQGATGFGVPAAVVAPLLVGLGFAPELAVTMALLGHGWAVSFGSLGSAYLSLIATTGIPGDVLANPTSFLLAICCLGCGFSVLWLSGKVQAVRQRGLFLLGMTAVMGLVQWALATSGLWTVASFGAGLTGLVLALAYFTISQNRNNKPTNGEPSANHRLMTLVKAFVPYYILMVVIVFGEIVLNGRLDFVTINYDFGSVATTFGWETAAESGRSISLFGHAGALLIYTTLTTFLWYRWNGTHTQSVYSARAILRKAVKGWIKPTIGIYAMVAMALTMSHAGMTEMLAQTLSATAVLFPLLSPFIGALGAFMTGSNTNSNVVFGQLQMQTAVALNLSVGLILAAQTAGGAVGSIFAPAKVIVGCSTVGEAEDGPVLKMTTLYSLLIILVVGLVVWGVTLISG